ncbi:MAG: type IV toxin-antitoxin system AbiEi family antitoxin domain-containing protein [Dermatophilaceae bacterium]
MPSATSTRGHATSAGVEALAEAQLGLLTRAQCLGLGMTPGALKWMVRANRWQRVHLGVYATHTGPLDWSARVSAALLSCGEGAVASHGTAARLHGLVERDPDVIEVLIPRNRRVSRPSQVRLSTCAEISARTAPSGWPTRTTVEDTVLDLADHGDADNAIAWLSKACQRRRTTPARLAEALDKRARHRWRELLVGALSDVGAGVESVLEYRYVRRVERPHGLPEARRQQVVIVGGRRRRSDNEYKPFGVVVELDGRLGHEADGVFRDRSRDNSTTVSGKASLRFGWADVDAQPCEVAQDVAEVLRSRGWPGSLRRCGVHCRLSKRTS